MSGKNEISRYSAFKISVLIFLALSVLAASGMIAADRGGILEIYRKGIGESAPAFHSRRASGVSFDNYSEKVNLIVHYYLKSGYSIPEHFPSHTIEWRAFIHIPDSGRYGFRINSSHPFRMEINGDAVLEEAGEKFLPLHSGVYEFNLKYYNDDGERGVNVFNRQIMPGRPYRGIPVGNLELLWNTPDNGGWASIPGEAFSRADRSEGLAAWGIPGLIVFLGLLAAVLMAAFDPGLYKGAIIRNRAGLAAGCIFILGFALRFYQHGLIPVYNETWDEIGAGWSGWSVISWGVPASWSLLLDAYGPGRPAVSWFGNHFNIVAPYFDHPPLFSLAAGAVAMLGGADELLRVSVSSMRILPVIFSSTVIILLYLILKAHYSRRTALLASFLYAIIPTIVVSGRLVQEDNMMLFLVMLGLLFYSKSLEKESWRASLPVALAVGFASLAKFTAVSFIGAFSLLYLIRGRWKSAAAVFGLGGGLCLLYFAWGAFVDWEMFMRVFAVQGGKIPQLALPARMAFQPKLVETLFWDGGILFLWLSVPAFVFVKKDGFSRDMGILFAVYFILISTTVIYDRDYGWYRIMMFPFLCAAGGIMLNELVKTRSVLLMVFFAGLGVMLNLQAVLPARTVMDANLPKFLAAGFLLPLIPAQIWKTEKWERLALFAVLTALFVYALTSVIMIIDFAEIYYGGPWWGRTL